MSSVLKRFFSDIDPKDFLKVSLLTIIFFLLIGSYTVLKELKDAVFTTIVGFGRDDQSYVKMLSMFLLIPAILLHSKLVDVVKKHRLLYIYAGIFGGLGLLFAYLLSSSTVGMAQSADMPKNKIVGWLFYCFIESISPMLVSVFWAFTNSINTPQSVKNNYIAIITGSKVGGILLSLFAMCFLRLSRFGDIANIQLLLIACSLVFLAIPIVVYYLANKVAHSDLHGYEAAYREEKKHPHENRSWYSSMTEGLVLLFKYPYVMGIFGMSFFFEIVNQSIKIENIIFNKSNSPILSEFTYTLIWQAVLVHIVGLIVIVFGTKAILQALGERKSLMLIPTVTGAAILLFLLMPSYTTAVIAFVVTRSINYAFSVPVRESLYIPTIKEIRFKSKSWIDGIGSKFAKTFASTYQATAQRVAGQYLAIAQSGFFSVMVLAWVATAYALGRRYEQTIQNNEVIGAEKI